MYIKLELLMRRGDAKRLDGFRITLNCDLGFWTTLRLDGILRHMHAIPICRVCVHSSNPLMTK